MPRVAKAAVRRKTPNAINNNEEGPVKKIQRLTFNLPLPKIESITGKVLVCGQGDMGQLGLGDGDSDMERKRPTLVNSITNIVDVRAGGMHNLCLDKKGEVYSFGCNDEGALGRDSSEDGSEFVPKKVDLPGRCLRISAGDSHSACLLDDGRVFAWGSFRDSHGNMGLTLEGNKRLPVEVLPGVVSCDIASGADHLVVLSCSGKVYTMGCGEQGQLGRVSLRSASGESRRGKTELLRPGLVSIKRGKLVESIWATTYCTFLKESNSPNIWGFGLNNYKQLGYPKETSVIINPINTQFEDVRTIAGGQHHTLVLKNDNTCYSIGRKDYGRLGLGNISEDANELKLIKALSDKNVVNVSCGEAQSFAITKEGHVYAWGMGSSLQLGTGDEDDALEPTLIASKQTQGRKVVRAYGGGQHSIFLVADENLMMDIETHTKTKSSNRFISEPIETSKDVITNGNIEQDQVAANEAASIAKKGRKKK